MSILIYILHDDFVVLATDSLASEKGLGPLKFANKIFPLPYLNSVVSGTGMMDLTINWYTFIQKSVVIQDIVILDKIAQEKLPVLFDSYANSDFSTVYQFGYSEEEKKHIGFAYRSTNGFKSERLIQSIGIKPSDNIDITNNMPGSEEALEEYVVRMAVEQKCIDDQKNEDEKLGIGGNLYYSLLNKDNFSIKEIFEFPDKTTQFEKMLNKLRSRNSEMF
jgi:hypothetical protein